MFEFVSLIATVVFRDYCMTLLKLHFDSEIPYFVDFSTLYSQS